MRVAVLGLGSIGMRHARNFRSLGVETLIGMDPSEERRDRFAAEIGAEAVVRLEDVLAGAPTLAIVASPNVHHVPQALACARSGIHLLVEKPLGASADGVPALIEAVESAGLFAHVGSNWKFHPAFATMKRLVAEESVGRIVAAQVLAGQWLPDWHPWEDYRQGYSARADLGGGVVLDSHELDYLAWLLGPVETLTGAVRRTEAIAISTEDVACAVLRFESGALGCLQIDYIQRRTQRRYTLTGTEGTIVWDLHAGCVEVVRPGASAVERHDATMSDLNAMYVDQARHVLEGIARGNAPITSLRHAAHVLDLQLAWRALW